MKPKFLNDNDPWMLAEDIPDCDLFFSQIWLWCFVNWSHKHTGRTYKKILCKYKDAYHLWFYFGEKDSFEVGENIVNRIVNEKDYAQKINKNIIKQADKLRQFCEKIPQKNLDKLSNKKLWEIYDKQDKIHKEYYTWCWIPVAADMFHNNLTNRVKEYLRGIGVNENKLTEYFITLTQPTKKSLIFIEQQELLKIGEENDTKKRTRLLEKHRQKYYYTKFLWVEGEYEAEDYLQQLRDILCDKESCAAIIKKQNENLRMANKRKNELIKTLKMKKKWRVIFNAFGDFMVTKIYRRYAQIFAMYQMDKVLKEIGRRFYLTRKQVSVMLPREVKVMLLKNKYDEHLLNKRIKACVYYAEKGRDEVLVGEEAKALLSQIQEKDYTDIKEIRGETACQGYAKGKVKIIIRPADVAKMNKGDVLVSIATDPNIVPAMKKASAIVTDMGGITCHAAIVSRELGIPCVIGTKSATQTFSDGDLVEVNANHGTVYLVN